MACVSTSSDVRRVALAVGRAGTALFKIIRPAMGMQSGNVTKAAIRDKWRIMPKTSIAEIKAIWTDEYVTVASQSCTVMTNL